MNRQHPYGGYDAGPNDRGNRPNMGSGGAYPGENLPPGGGYYPPAGGHQQQAHHQQQQPSHYPPPMSGGQNEFQGGPNRDYREGGGPYPPQHDFRGGSGPPPGMPPGGAGSSRPALTLGPGPLNNQTQYGGGPMRFDGSGAPPGGAQPSALPMIPYGSSPAQPGPPMRGNLPPPMRQQGYDSNLPRKPDPTYGMTAPQGNMVSPPVHLPRPPSRDWGGDDQSRKRARRDGSHADEGKDSDELIKDRLKRERPCRTLFVRNVEFNADVADLRRRFEAFGEVKSYFDLTSKRGLLFISYYDLRSAECAKASMQEFEVNGRKVDVHYSLPRESDMTKRCDRDKDQGTLFILLKRAQGELNDDEVRATFAQYGEIKSLRRYKDQGNCRFLEYYDHRACKAANDAMIGTSWNGGQWDIKFAWDAATPDRAGEPPKGSQQWNQGYGPMAPQGQPQQHPQQMQQAGPPRWGGAAGGDQYPAQAPQNAYGGAPEATNAGYAPYGGPPGPPGAPVRPNYAAPPGPGNFSQGTKRPFDHDDRGGQEPPMRRWGQAQGSAVAPPPVSYGQGRPGEQGAPGPGPGPGYGPNRPPYPGQGGGGAAGNPAEYGRYGSAANGSNEYGPPQPQGNTNNSRWQGAPVPPSVGPPGPPSGPNAGYVHGSPQSQSQSQFPARQQQQQQQQGNQMPPMQRPPPQQHQQRPPPPSNNDGRLEQAQKVQQLLASLKPGGNLNSPSAGTVTAPPASAASPTPPPAPAAAATPAPSLPSNIAALLKMAQANSAKK